MVGFKRLSIVEEMDNKSRPLWDMYCAIYL